MVLEIFDATQSGTPLVNTWTASVSGSNTIFTGPSGGTLNLGDTYWFEIAGNSATTAGAPFLPGAGTSSALSYTFGGASTTVNLSNSTTQVTLNPYKGITVQIQVQSAPVGSGTLSFSDALNANGDVTPPSGGSSLPADTAVTGYTPIIYLSEANPGPANVTMNFSGSTTLTVSGANLASKTTCRLDGYLYNGSGFAWQTAAPVVGSTINAATNSATLTVYGNLGTITTVMPPGQEIAAVSCQ